MTAIFSRIRFNTRQVIAMAVFVALASAAQMVSPMLVSGMISSDEKTIIILAAAMAALAHASGRRRGNSGSAAR